MFACVYNTGITVEEVAANAGVELSTLSKECPEYMLLNFAKFCIEWKLIGRRLELSKADVEAVDCDDRTEREKRFGMLEKWKEKFAFRATYKSLIESLLAEGKSTDAIHVAKIIGEAAVTGKFSVCHTCTYH